MAAGDRFERRRQVARQNADDASTVFRVVRALSKDDEAAANSRSEQAPRSRGHRERGLARGNETDVARTFRSAGTGRAEGPHDVSGPRAFEQTTGGSRADSGTDNRQEVRSKIGG